MFTSPARHRRVARRSAGSVDSRARRTKCQISAVITDAIPPSSAPRRRIVQVLVVHTQKAHCVDPVASSVRAVGEGVAAAVHHGDEIGTRQPALDVGRSSVPSEREQQVDHDRARMPAMFTPLTDSAARRPRQLAGSQVNPTRPSAVRRVVSSPVPRIEPLPERPGDDQRQGRPQARRRSGSRLSDLGAITRSSTARRSRARSRTPQRSQPAGTHR